MGEFVGNGVPVLVAAITTVGRDMGLAINDRRESPQSGRQLVLLLTCVSAI
jgi:hypothetical protein